MVGSAEATNANRLLNPSRLKVYPRLMLAAMVTVIVANVLLGSGWLGAVGQIVGSDFVTLYASGRVWRHDRDRLYDFDHQAAAQQSLIEPTELPGLNPYISPPYVAMAYSGLTHVRLVFAFILWQVLTVGAVLVSAHILAGEIVTQSTTNGRLRCAQLAVVILSCFSFVEGFVAGQNHGVTLLLATAAAVLSTRRRSVWAGLCAGLLIYKPQFVAGFIVVWLFWGEYRSLLGTAVTAGTWLMASLLVGGTQPFASYLALGEQLLRLPYTAGFPAYLMVTPYGLLATVLGESWMSATWLAARAWAALMTLGLCALALRARKGGRERRRYVLGAALLYPLVVSPYTLLHDLVLLAPVFVLLWPNGASERRLTLLAVVTYTAMLFLTLLGQLTRIALVALIPTTFAAVELRRIWLASG